MGNGFGIHVFECQFHLLIVKFETIFKFFSWEFTGIYLGAIKHTPKIYIGIQGVKNKKQWEMTDVSFRVDKRRALFWGGVV